MHHPTSEHRNVAKWLFRYLCGTLTCGLFLHKQNQLSFHAFLDADWVGNRDNYTSTKLGVTLPTQPVIYSDNVGATYLFSNLVFHSHMKHMAIFYHFIRDQVQLGSLRVTHVSLVDQLSNVLPNRFHENTSKN
ncbi:Retrovirus-related Pol polyprotein from transposon TNT 1-94 [Gossypium australe]|uniref:Retrovirus-related Pol polyprotein from transposon TNT 1-94 n=1 Tax=Gossypium australe TaxID=47621 RepID=A0A5B6VMH6_9ROSI|nr:Retrovirus-related Pol polyprotein from transposon TNT 1-94 [Gossypium australe]